MNNYTPKKMKNKKTQYRYERKFIIEKTCNPEFLVKHHPANFIKQHNLRQINNIYFDTPNYSSYTDNKEGNPQREKIRIRWYGEPFGKINNPILEIKQKQGEI